MKEKILERWMVDICNATDGVEEEELQYKAECLAYIKGMSEMCCNILEIIERSEEKNDNN